jgi:hypothetical protein
MVMMVGDRYSMGNKYRHVHGLPLFLSLPVRGCYDDVAACPLMTVPQFCQLSSKRRRRAPPPNWLDSASGFG